MKLSEFLNSIPGDAYIHIHGQWEWKGRLENLTYLDAEPIRRKRIRRIEAVSENYFNIYVYASIDG